MAIDRSVRNLHDIRGASSSRVLNLNAIARTQVDNPGFRQKPLFLSPIINTAIVLKHRLRADELSDFTEQRSAATKVIVPFEKADLRVGGRSLFVGQRKYMDLLRDIGNYKNDFDLDRDARVLELMDAIPSLDPFLLREHLRSNDVNVDQSYFVLSIADQEKMFEYAAKDVRRLTALALGGAKGATRDPATSKIVAALLSDGDGDQLAPLRATLQLEPEEFAEGVFSWRGFLYYKWTFEDYWPTVIDTLRDINRIHPTQGDAELVAYLGNVKRSIIQMVKVNGDDVKRILGVYDNVYSQLVDNHSPGQFREFLLNAPSMFVRMGEKLGAMIHVTSFWRYRFPTAAPRAINGDDLGAIFKDFAQSLGIDRIAMVRSF